MSSKMKLVTIFSALALLVGMTAAIAKPNGDGDNGGKGGDAQITGSFSDDCRDFEADSTKEISHVETHYADGRVEKDESVNSRHYEADGDEGDEIDYVIVKSGTKSERFDCDGGPQAPECSDDADNADPEDELADEDDPGCHTDGDADNPDSYDPDDNDETDEADAPECSDDVDNADAEDELADEDDPGCHTDGDATNPDSYDPDDDDETDEADAPECSDDVDNADAEDELADEDDPGCHTDGDATNPDSYDPDDDDETDEEVEEPGRWTCRASALRVENHPLDALLDDPFEEFVANAGGDPCADGSDSLVDRTVTAAPGSLAVRVLHATTSDDNGADASAGAAEVVIKNAAGATLVRAGVLNATAEGRCVGGAPTLTSRSEVVGLEVLGQKVDVPPNQAHMHILLPANLGTLHVNHDERVIADPAPGSDGQVSEVETRRALWLDTNTPLGDVIVGEAIVDRHGNPC